MLSYGWQTTHCMPVRNLYTIHSVPIYHLSSTHLRLLRCIHPHNPPTTEGRGQQHTFCRFWRTSRTKCILRDSGCSGLARWMEKVCRVATSIPVSVSTTSTAVLTPDSASFYFQSDISPCALDPSFLVSKVQHIWGLHYLIIHPFWMLFSACSQDSSAFQALDPFFHLLYLRLSPMQISGLH